MDDLKDNDGNSVAPIVKPPKLKRPRGRPAGYSPKRDPNLFKMKNGRVYPDHIFLYVKKKTLPKSEVNRFLELCDLLITSLGPDSLKGPDVEEIALLYRDRIYLDKIYERLIDEKTQENDGLDTTMLKQIESLSKQLETRKDNLSLRFKDLGKKRDDHAGKTMMDLLAEFKEDEAKLGRKAARMTEEMKEFEKKTTTSATSYMERHLTVDVSDLATDSDKQD